MKMLDHSYKLYHEFFTEAIFATLATALSLYIVTYMTLIPQREII